MDLLTIIQFSILAIAALIVGFSSNSRLNDFIKLISLVSIGIILSNQSEGDVQVLYTIVGLAAFNFVLSRFSLFKKGIYTLLAVLLSAVLFISIAYGNVLSINGDSFSILNKFSITGIFVAAFSYQFMDLKGLALMKIFKVEKDLFYRSVNLFFLAFSIYLTTFGAGVFGLFLSASFYLISNFYREDEEVKNYPLAFGILIISYSLAMGHSSAINLVEGDVMFGILTGVFCVLFLYQNSLSKERNVILSIIVVLLTFGIATVLIYAGSMHPGMGGQDSVMGMIFGLSIASVFVSIELISIGIMIGLFVIVSTIPSFFINEELLQFEENTIKSTKTENTVDDEIIEEQYLSLNGVVGNFQIIEDSSSVSFTLGKKNETKGAFKKIAGSIDFKENIEQSSFEINLAMSDFTTFNKFRDESLVSEEYFNVSKFPRMKFKADRMVEIDSLNYELSGTFEMLGKKLEEKVSLQRVESDLGLVLVGKGKIDRTKYGMSPSATEGNIVTFEYRARLR